MIAKLERRANKNDLWAITKLAEIYSDGRSMRVNNKKVERYLKMGAALNDPYLTWCLADATYHGVGIAKSKQQGLELLRKAARLGVADAWTAIGAHWFENGGKDGQRKAISYYRKAAKAKEPHALHNLGVIYSSGKGLRRNLPLAHKYFLSAAKLGHAEAQFKVGWDLYFGEGVTRNQRAARTWLKKAAKQKHREAIELLKKSSKEANSK